MSRANSGPTSGHTFCSALLRMGFAQPVRSPGPLVVSYTTVSPLPNAPPAEEFWRSALCCTIPSSHLAWTLSSILALWSSDFPRAHESPAIAQSAWAP